MRAKQDYVKGVYYLKFIKNEKGKSVWDLVFTYSLTGDPTGRDRMNCDLTLEENITCDQLKDAIKKHKITRAIWYGRDNYVTPKEIKSGKWHGIIVCNHNVW